MGIEALGWLVLGSGGRVRIRGLSDPPAADPCSRGTAPARRRRAEQCRALGTTSAGVKSNSRPDQGMDLTLALTRRSSALRAELTRQAGAALRRRGEERRIPGPRSGPPQRQGGPHPGAPGPKTATSAPASRRSEAKREEERKCRQRRSWLLLEDAPAAASPMPSGPLSAEALLTNNHSFLELAGQRWKDGSARTGSEPAAACHRRPREAAEGLPGKGRRPDPRDRKRPQLAYATLTEQIKSLALRRGSSRAKRPPTSSAPSAHRPVRGRWGEISSSGSWRWRE